MRKLCPRCDREFEGEVDRCPDDGGDLVPLRQNDELVGRTIDGRFDVRKLLGRGGMGAVYLAHQRSVDRLVALKVLRRDLSDDASLARRFILEARAACRLENPHTVLIHDFGKTEDGMLYLAMEFLRGGSLRDRMRKVGPMPVEDVLRITEEVAESLAEAHGHGIFHRDVKPENVFLSERRGGGETVKVMDYGLARARPTPGESAITGAGVVMGTPAYMSPEVVTGQVADARADVYALGIMMYEMLTGIPPYQGATPMQVLLQHVQAEPQFIGAVAPAARVPPSIRALVWQCIAKDRAARPQDGAGFLAALRDARRRTDEGEPEPVAVAPAAISAAAHAAAPESPAPPPTDTPRTPPTEPYFAQRGRRSSATARLILAGLAALVVAIAAAAAALLWSDSEEGIPGTPPPMPAPPAAAVGVTPGPMGTGADARGDDRM